MQAVGVVVVSCNRAVLGMMLKSTSNFAMKEGEMRMTGCVKAVQGVGVVSCN